jgi:hypothetical protein
VAGRSIGGDVKRAMASICADAGQGRCRLFEAGDVGELQANDLGPEALFQLFGATSRDDPAVVEQGDPVGQDVRFFEILRRQQDCHAVVHELPDGFPELLTTARVEPGRRLVQEEQARSLDHAHGEVQAPPRATGIGPGAPVAGVGQLK